MILEFASTTRNILQL